MDYIRGHRGPYCQAFAPWERPREGIVTTLIGIGASYWAVRGRAIGIYHRGQGAGFLMSVLGQS